MSDKKTDDVKQGRAKTAQERPVIGLLCERLIEEWTAGLWAGARDAAFEHGANLFCFSGSTLRDPRPTGTPANVIYDLAATERLDGLVIWGAQLAYHVTLEELAAFCERFRPLPIVNIGLEWEGVPSLLVDNYQGMYDVVSHLIEVHGYRRIAYICGPGSTSEARGRYLGYADALADHGISLNRRFIVTGSDMEELYRKNVDSGEIGVHVLLDQRKLRPKVDFDALAGRNDGTCWFALKALKARGVHVPADVAMVSFDDLQESRYQTPPLTAARQPFYDQGWHGVEMLLAQLRGEPLPDQVVLPMEVIVRQSCGCADPAVAAVGEVVSERPARAAGHKKSLAALTRDRQKVIAEMAREVGATEEAARWAGEVLDSVVAEVNGETSGDFVRVLEEVLHRVAATGDDLSTDLGEAVAAWQGALSVLRRRLWPHLDGDALVRAEHLWQQARVLVGETARRVRGYQAVQVWRQARLLQEVEAELITTFDLDELMDVLAENLPSLGIPSTYLSLYEKSPEPVAGAPQPHARLYQVSEWSRLVLAYDEADAERPGGRIELEADGRRFRSRELVPEGILPERQYSFVVEPLYFQQRQLGFGLFEVGSRDGMVYAVLRGNISSALQGALLMEQVKHRALQLQTAAEVSRAVTGVLDLDTLLQQVVDLVQKRFDLYYVGLFLIEADEPVDPSAPSAWAVLRAASGEVGHQMLEQGHRLAVGGDSMVGQCITDHQPRIALDVGEEAVRFDNPLLPETHSEMALPLVTREGAIGALSVQSRERRAFGEAEVAVFETLAGQLANAIANARAYAQVARAYDEIQRLNERLKDENLRMAAELDVTRRLQQMLLPTDEELARIDGLDIAGWMEPAEEVGGDYYDVLQHNGSVKIGIGDVTGHGLESGVVMLMLQTAVRTLLTEGEEDPVRFLEVLNQLLRDNIRRMQVSKSMTLSLLDYELGRMRLSGQHEYVIVVRAGGKVELQDTLDLGFPLGIEHGIAQWVDKMDIVLAPGDGVVLYSDGITEAEDEAREFYGLKRLCEVVSANWGGSAEEIKDAVVADVKTFIGTQTVYDDLTLVVMKQLEPRGDRELETD